MAHLCGKMLSNNPRDMIYFPFIHVSLIFIYIDIIFISASLLFMLTECFYTVNFALWILGYFLGVGKLTFTAQLMAMLDVCIRFLNEPPLDI